jgi:hypothetical protein
MEGAGTVEPQGHGFDIDAQNPRGTGAAAADVWRGGDGGGGDVVLAFDFVDSLGGISGCAERRLM